MHQRGVRYALDNITPTMTSGLNFMKQLEGNLTPDEEKALEKLEKEYDGKVEFTKLNTDENPNIAARYGIFSIPTVMMFYNGELVNTFIGAMPESAVRYEIEKALKKTEL